MESDEGRGEATEKKVAPLRLYRHVVVVFVILTFTLGLTINFNQPGATEKIFYLASLGATIFPTTLPSPSPYGQINLACRTGWRYIEPVSPTVSQTPDWTTIDQCKSAAHTMGAKWSLSIKIGADTPLWLYNNSCQATPVAGEGTPGHGTLQAFNFNWQIAGQPYTVGSTQCLPVPWGANYLSQLNTFIQAVGSHIGTDASLDHVVVTGINYTTQENMQPHCSPASTATPYTCGIDGVHSDIDNWVTIIQNDGHPSCTATSCSVYNELLLGGPGIPNAYATIVADWGSAFPSSVKLASMFVNSGVNSFPFNTTTDLGVGLLNDVVSYDSTRSIVMNNAASMTQAATATPSPALVNPILCYKGTETPGFACPASPSPQPTSTIGFQELGPQYDPLRLGCGNVYALLSAASTDKSALMETYPVDITNCF